VPGLRVNFTDKEASSEARDFTPVPAGKYKAVITEDSAWAECGPESKNPGKPYWNLNLLIEEGPYSGRHIFTNVMLFDGALYSLSQLMKALGYDIESGEFEVPQLEELLTQSVGVQVKIQAKTTDKKSGKEYDERNEVRGFLPADHESIDNGQEAYAKAQAAGGTKATLGTQKTSLLPD
jgi:hypothetical protein